MVTHNLNPNTKEVEAVRSLSFQSQPPDVHSMFRARLSYPKLKNKITEFTIRHKEINDSATGLRNIKCTKKCLYPQNTLTLSHCYKLVQYLLMPHHKRENCLVGIINGTWWFQPTIACLLEHEKLQYVQL